MTEVLIWIVLIGSLALNLYTLHLNRETRRMIRGLRVQVEAAEQFRTLRWEQIVGKPSDLEFRRAAS